MVDGRSALLPQRIRLIQNRRDPPLLGEVVAELATRLQVVVIDPALLLRLASFATICASSRVVLREIADDSLSISRIAQTNSNQI